MAELPNFSAKKSTIHANKASVLSSFSINRVPYESPEFRVGKPLQIDFQFFLGQRGEIDVLKNIEAEQLLVLVKIECEHAEI